MNGVRRFLGGSTAVVSPTDPSSSSLLQSQPQSIFIAPDGDEATPTQSAASSRINLPPPPTSRPSSDDSNFSPNRDGRFSSPMMSPSSPGTTTKGAFFSRKKDSLPRQPLIWDDDRRSSDMSSRSRSSSLPGRGSRPTSPRAGPSTTSSRPPLPSLAKAIKASDASSRASPATSVPLSGSSLTWKNANSLLNMKDELLVSLLASQAVVDSKDSEILSAEEVEELKREYTLVTSRVSSAARKLSTETRIRDAASKLHNFGQSSTSSTNDQLTTANRKVEAAQQEIYRLSDRANELSRRLLEHRAGVLSFSVRSLEKKAAMALAGTSGDTDSDTSTGLSGDMSPASTTATSLSVAPSRKFDGAHFFAGHADAVTPSLATPGRLRELETRLKRSIDEAALLRKTQSSMEHDIEIMGLEKTAIETRMSLELQSAEERIESLEAEVESTAEMAERLDELQMARQEWERDRGQLEDRLRMAESVAGRNPEMEEAVIRLQAEVLNKDLENRRLLEERRSLESEKVAASEELFGARDELVRAREALRAMCRANRIVTPLNETSVSVFVTALESHITGLDEQREQMMESRERLNSELETARREREDARREAYKLKERSSSLGDVSVRTGSPASSVMRRGSGDSEDSDRVISLFKPIWAILPSVEARATKLGNSRAVTPRSPKNTKTPDSSPLSLSELDVRSLKALYDPKGNFASSSVQGEFSLEDFASRVQALVADDRALVERLIRFAQAHDLLKSNAERAQKLAQESSMGLETYQKQVKTLEERNQTLTSKQTSLFDEIDDLQVALERLEEQKRSLEEQAGEQAETCKSLHEANDTLSAKTLALAAEVSAAPEQLKKLEQQIATLMKQLADANDELDRTRMAESLQRAALLDELNSLQDENGTLRNQLRRQGSK